MQGTDPGAVFLDRVRRSSASVLGASETGRRVAALCEEHKRARKLITQDRAAGALVLGFVGATGQGKSWLIRQIVRRSAATAEIRSGNNLDEATEELVWIGPQPPADLDHRFERFVPVSKDDMEPMETPYMLVDAPGATDDRAAIVDVARRALSLASALVLVVRRDQIRGQTPSMLAGASEGTLLLPVINAVGSNDEAFEADVDAFLANLRDVAPGSLIAAPIFVDDFERNESEESEVGADAAKRVLSKLQEELRNNPDSDRRKSTRLAALDERFRIALRSLLEVELPGVTRAVERLHAEADKLPGSVARSLIGSEGPMEAAVRGRLRLKLLTSTGSIWFPYRSILGLLNLTHGAWDRVVLSLSGSLPSLVSTIWTSTRSLASQRDADSELQDGLRRRSTAAVTDRLGPLANQFRSELALLRRESTTTSGDQRDYVTSHSPEHHVASLAGLDTLQERSHACFESSIADNAISKKPAVLMAIGCTVVFWAFMAGPFVALYSDYLHASYASLVGGGESTLPPIEQFPKPEFAMIATALFLSFAPTAVLAMFCLSFAQSNSRTRRTLDVIRKGHDDAIAELQDENVLRLQWEDALLTDAEFLVRAGSLGDTAS